MVFFQTVSIEVQPARALSDSRQGIHLLSSASFTSRYPVLHPASSHFLSNFYIDLCKISRAAGFSLYCASASVHAQVLSRILGWQTSLRSLGPCSHAQWLLVSLSAFARYSRGGTGVPMVFCSRVSRLIIWERVFVFPRMASAPMYRFVTACFPQGTGLCSLSSGNWAISQTEMKYQELLHHA